MYELATRLPKSEIPITTSDTTGTRMDISDAHPDGVLHAEEALAVLRSREEALFASLNAICLSHRQYFVMGNPRESLAWRDDDSGMLFLSMCLTF